MNLNHGYETIVNRVWNSTLGKVPEKVFAWGLGLTAAGFLVAGGVNKYQDNKAEQAAIADMEARMARTAELVAKEDSLVTYGLNLVGSGKLDDAEAIYAEAEAVRPNYTVARKLETAISEARAQERADAKLLALRLHFVGNEFFATEDAHTLWDIAPLYYEALTGKKAKFGDDRQWGNLWMDMVKYRKSLGKDAENIEVGERVELPSKGLMDLIIESEVQ